MGVRTALQVALDCTIRESALNLSDEVAEYVDILEAGTPLIKIAGLSIVKELKEKYPDKKVLADMKTMDVGRLEAEQAFREKADIVTVLGASSDETIRGAVEAARDYNKEVMVDLISVEDKAGRAKEAERLGADYIGVHSGIDRQDKENPLEDLKKIMDSASVKVIVAGGININTIGSFRELSPDVIVVGGGITKADDPSQSAKELKEALK